MTRRYTISEVSAASPDMDDEQFAAFVEDIREYGQLVPIVVRGSEVIDGRKRLRACELLGREPNVIDVFPNQTPEAATNSLNGLRTHYSTTQRGMLAARQPRAPHGRAIKVAGLDVKGSKELARDAIGKEFGVSEATVHRGRFIRDHGIPELIKAAEQNRVKISMAARIARAVEAEQPELLARALAPRPKRRPKPGSVNPHLFKGKSRSTAEQIAERTTDTVLTSAELLESVRGSLNGTGARSVWADRLRKARTHISRFISTCEER